MASIRKIGPRKWQAQVARKGLRKSRCFRTRIEASDWASELERSVRSGVTDLSLNRTMGDLFRRYSKEVSPKKRTALAEQSTLAMLSREPLGSMRLRDASAAGFSMWRDDKLLTLAPASVARRMVLISHVFTVARKEWGWVNENPLQDVRFPRPGPPRDRRISQEEIIRLAQAINYEFDSPHLSRTDMRTFHAFLFAIETGMRAGEIASLIWSNIDFDSRVAHLPMTKNGHPRDVPMNSAATDLLRALPQGRSPTCFGLKPAGISVSFITIKKKAGIDDLCFHDSRHEAITRLARKLDVLTLARMVGHRDIRMLQIYYNESAADIARRLG